MTRAAAPSQEVIEGVKIQAGALWRWSASGCPRDPEEHVTPLKLDCHSQFPLSSSAFPAQATRLDIGSTSGQELKPLGIFPFPNCSLTFTEASARLCQTHNAPRLKHLTSKYARHNNLYLRLQAANWSTLGCRQLSPEAQQPKLPALLKELFFAFFFLSTAFLRSLWV